MSAPVENLISRLQAKRSSKGWIARCPAHDDNRPSLSIDEGADGRALVYCQAGCPVDAVLSALGLTRKDLFPLNALATSSGHGGPLRSTPTPTPFDWEKCVDAFTDKQVEHVAKWRGFSPEFLRELRDAKLIGIFNGLVAFPVHKDGQIVGCHYRSKQKNNPWYYFPQGIKAAAFVVGELTPGERVQCFESTWDGLDYMDKSGERDGIIITRGTGNAKFAQLLPSTCTLYAWTQNDDAGRDWEQKVCTYTKCLVKRVKIPAPHKDLNDWTRAGATVDQLVTAMKQAETIHEPEKSWHDALKAAVITSGELRELQLVPRKKLLGDWFCEGDLGFIFAFRGVGKTWLAVAIAQALATGGKLGDWQAHEPVKVLYVDGEMPPDLMRDRCGGLQGNE